MASSSSVRACAIGSSSEGATGSRAHDRCRVLLADDDTLFLRTTELALGALGFEVATASSARFATELAMRQPCDLAIVDLYLGDATGLELVRRLRRLRPDAEILVVSGFGSVAAAVEAVHLGALDFLLKPISVHEILGALVRRERAALPNPSAMSLARAEWEHLQLVMRQVQGNISLAARQLRIARRTLQRKLQKRPPSD